MLFLGPGLGGVVLLALWIYCIFDCISTDESLVRNLPKGMWLVIVIFLPSIGSIAWLLLGRPQFAGWRPGDTSVRPVRQFRAPEDDPGWSARPAAPPADEVARLAAWEDDLKRREAALENQDEPDEDDGFGFRS